MREDEETTGFFAPRIQRKLDFRGPAAAGRRGEQASSRHLNQDTIRPLPLWSSPVRELH